MTFTKTTIPNALDWVLGLLEQLIVLVITFLIGYVVYCFIRGTNGRDNLIDLMGVVNENWKAAIILLIPLFYRPIRTFLDRLEQGPFGMKAKSVPVIEKEEKANP
jgi:hypothetical protein